MTDQTTDSPRETMDGPQGVQGASGGELAGRDGDSGAKAASGGPLRQRIAAAVEAEIYEYRERTMLWEETGGVTQEIARLATRGALQAISQQTRPAATEATDHPDPADARRAWMRGELSSRAYFAMARSSIRRPHAWQRLTQWIRRSRTKSQP